MDSFSRSKLALAPSEAALTLSSGPHSSTKSWASQPCQTNAYLATQMLKLTVKGARRQRHSNIGYGANRLKVVVYSSFAKVVSLIVKTTGNLLSANSSAQAEWPIAKR